MNYYQYKRREPRSRASDFIKPFLVILVFAGIVVAAWKYLGPALKGGDQEMTSEKVYLDIATGGAKAMTSGSTEWKTIPTNIYLYEDEKVRTQSDGRVTLSFFDSDVVRLDKSSQLSLTSLDRQSTMNHAVLTLDDGKLWANIHQGGATTTEFTIKTPVLTLTSDGGTFVVANPGMLYVLSGSVKADIQSNGKVVKSTTLGVGQELIVDEQIASNLAEGLNKEVIFALDDAFKTSNWYEWNQEQEGAGGSAAAESGSTETSAGSNPSATETATTGPAATPAATETPTATPSATESTQTKTGTTGSTATLETPQITSPGSNGASVTLTSAEQIISGTVSDATDGIIVNDYRLTLFKAGSGKFSYNAKVSYGNLNAGENKFEIVAVDKDGKKSKPATITLVLPQDIYDKAKADQTTGTGTASTTPAASSTGGVKITSPNGGANLTTTETAFVISGEVPAGTAKVVVNDYTLQSFKEGDTTFKYNAKVSLGTLQNGDNTYTVKAYDKDDKALGEASMTITLKGADTASSASVGVTAAAGDPVITMPAAAATYKTTLDELVLGGTVGKWVEILYINGQKLEDYIPGSESWKKTVTLTPGENTFTVYGEKSGQKTGTARITITYQN